MGPVQGNIMLRIRRYREVRRLGFLIGPVRNANFLRDNCWYPEAPNDVPHLSYYERLVYVERYQHGVSSGYQTMREDRLLVIVTALW